VRRHPRDLQSPAIPKQNETGATGAVGLVLSGGGSRAAYQAGALKALAPYLGLDGNKIQIIVGSSIGAVNGLVTGACLSQGVDYAATTLIDLWQEREFRNTFHGHPSAAFLRALKMAFFQYLSPGPKPTSDAIFNPTPLVDRVDGVIKAHGGLHPDKRAANLNAIATMTTVEGSKRKPLLFVSSREKIAPEIIHGASFEVSYVEEMTTKHGFASAALPSVLPPVELDTEHGKVRLVDGGISSNVPVDQALRLGAERIVCIDISGRAWWLNHYQEPLDTRPEWEVPSEEHTFCMRPPHTFSMVPSKALGPILKDAVASSTRKFIAAVGPTWPCFTVLKKKLGEELAYEVMSYVALDHDYLTGLIELGYNDVRNRLLKSGEPPFALMGDSEQEDC
jgi:predicted acylesterase/phospholipase RssA